MVLLVKKIAIETLVFLASIMAIIITGFSDTSSFFTGENSPIPQRYKLLKNQNNSSIISILILAAPPIILWILDRKTKNKDSQELLNTIRQDVIPAINLYLEKLSQDIKNRFNLQGSIRISLWIPVKVNRKILLWNFPILAWNLQMVCKTNNIPELELQASFQLNEGVIGHTYLQNQGKWQVAYIDISNFNNLPKFYKPLQRDNQILISSDIKGVLAIASFQESSILGLLAIDTDQISDSSEMQNDQLHKLAVEWIVEYSRIIKLLRRMKNNV